MPGFVTVWSELCALISVPRDLCLDACNKGWRGLWRGVCSVVASVLEVRDEVECKAVASTLDFFWSFGAMWVCMCV